MEEFTISGHESFLGEVLEHLEHGSFGRGIARAYDYKVQGNVISFKLKPGEKVKLSDLFWFGYFTKD